MKYVYFRVECLYNDTHTHARARTQTHTHTHTHTHHTLNTTLTSDTIFWKLRLFIVPDEYNHTLSSCVYK